MLSQVEFNTSLKGDFVIPTIPGFDLASFMKFAVHPTDTQAIFDLQKTMVLAPNRAEMIEAMNSAIEKSESFKALFEERYIPPFPKRSELLEYEVGSLGRAVGEHLATNNIELDFAGLDVSVFYPADMNLLTYLGVRGIRIHDILHTVLGLGVSPIEEYAVASFTLAQFRSPFHMMLVASGYIHTAFHTPSEIPNFLNTIHRYYNLGLKAEFVTGYRYEEHFSDSLAEVRQQLKIDL